MNKATVLRNINNYKGAYQALTSKIDQVKASDKLTNVGKREQIEKMTELTKEELQKAKASLIASLEELKGELIVNRRKEVAKGLEDAERINLVVSGIASEAYTTTMIEDMITAFNGNSVALAKIKGALEDSGEVAYHNIAMNIPKDQGNKVVDNLDKIIKKLNAEPTISFTEKNRAQDFGTQLYWSGATFDEWYRYIEENVNSGTNNIMTI